MDKITIIPGSVRGYGDVVSPKTLEDFLVFDSELSFEDGLYTLVYDSSSVSVGLSVSSGSISVGGSVVLTAEVLSAGEPASGETVSFYDGSTLLGTDGTDSDGIATYTASSLGVGSHSLTASALDKSSSAVTVTVNKLTSTITLSVPASGTVGTSYSITGTLVPTTGSVKLYENGVLKDTLTVSSGSFSKSITQSNEGTYSYYAVFEGSSTYEAVTSSTSSIVVSDVPTPTVDSVSLTGDKSILSYYDSESATLSATVLDGNDDPMEGVTVTFYNGSTSMGTADTNSSGVATKSYASSGVGDVSFTASVGTISSETYVVHDYQYYADSMSKIKNTFIVNTSVSGRTVYLSSFTFSSDVELEFKFKNTVPSNWLIGFGSDGTTTYTTKGYLFTIAGYNSSHTSIMWADSSNVARDASLRRVLSSSEVVKISTENINKIYWYIDDTVQASRDTYTGTPLGLRFDVFNNNDFELDYVKVKPL